MFMIILDRIKKGIPTNRHYRSLMKSMLLIGFFLPFLPMILVSGIIFYQFDAAYQDHVQIHLIEAVRKGKRNIDHFLNDKLDDLRFIAGSFGYEKLREADILKDILRKLQMQQSPVFVTLGLLDGGGREIAGTGSEKSFGTSYVESGWLKEVLKSGYGVNAVSTDPQGIPHIIMAVRGGTQNEPWVLLSRIDYAAFNRRVQDLRGDTGSAFIFSRGGQCLIRPASSINPTKGTGLDFPGFPDSDDAIAMVRRRDTAGQENIYVTTFLKSVDWLFVHRQGASEAFSGLNRAKKVTGAIVVLVGFCIALYALGLSRKMVRRIELADKKKQKMNEQMFQTGKLASIGELAAGIAHEINNPVAIMVEEAGWIEDLLEEESFQEMENLAEYKRALKQIQTQGQRCKVITHKLLSFARKADFRIQNVKLKALIEDIMAISSRRSKYNRVKIRLDIQENLPEFMLPPTELQQVLLNLMNNAIDVVEDGTGTVSIVAKLEEKDILIEVSDNGSGIPKEDLARIFDPFFTTKPVGKGTGLGLSICYGIVKRMGGEIRVNSIPGTGTTFRIRIPAVKAGDVPWQHSREMPDFHQHSESVTDGV